MCCSSLPTKRFRRIATAVRFLYDRKRRFGEIEALVGHAVTRRIADSYWLLSSYKVWFVVDFCVSSAILSQRAFYNHKTDLYTFGRVFGQGQSPVSSTLKILNFSCGCDRPNTEIERQLTSRPQDSAARQSDKSVWPRPDPRCPPFLIFQHVHSCQK